MKGPPGESEDGEPDPALDPESAPEIEAMFRPIDLRRIREIRRWLEGKRPDAPTRQEMLEFLDWVGAEIEWALSRHQSTEDLVFLLNAAREEVRRAEGAEPV